MEFGKFGGQMVGGPVLEAVKEVEKAYDLYKHDKEFIEEFRFYLKNYANRPSLLYYAKNLTEKLGGAKIYLKREDLNHTGAHKINNVLGQALLAKRMGKTKLIAETGADGLCRCFKTKFKCLSYGTFRCESRRCS